MSYTIDSTTIIKRKAIWTGNLYTLGTPQALNEPLEAGGIYIIEAWGLSSYYKRNFLATIASLFDASLIQAAYSDGTNSCRWRISLNPTNNTFALDTGSTNMSANTAITAIYKLVIG